MNAFRFVKGVAVSLATLGIVCPSLPAYADNRPTAPIPPVVKTATINTLPDVFLTSGGTLSGRVVDHNGNVINGAMVTIRQGDKEIAKAVTAKDGLYSFKNLKGGVYKISSGNTEGVFRVWAEKSGPPVAKEHALLVMGENGARGQFGCCDPTLILLAAGVIAAVVISAITLNKLNEHDDKVAPASP